MLDFPSVPENEFNELVLQSPDLHLQLTRSGTAILIGAADGGPVKYALNRAIARVNGWEKLFDPIDEPEAHT